MCSNNVRVNSGDTTLKGNLELLPFLRLGLACSHRGTPTNVYAVVYRTLLLYFRGSIDKNRKGSYVTPTLTTNWKGFREDPPA